MPKSFLLSLLLAGLASAHGAPRPLTAEAVAPCVALRALPALSLDYLDARHSEQGMAMLLLLEQGSELAAEDQAWWREQLAQPGEIDDARLRHWAEQGFERCTARLVPDSSPGQRAACGADLDTLPVILLYRADGLPLKEARRDLREALAQGVDGLEAGRAEAMLRFGYEGTGPRKGDTSAWLRERQERWVARCLQVRTAKSQP
ncbi:hypothetical protein [Roseateles flavus]|uniref:Lysozyme inhibitor LprI N-terminal domain-containing protein n=1 Tax=Roseateles flavus TaxID=3149041 RepID=A0ABV0GF30_9BURK